MALEPITRQEQIIAGKDLEPITRMEKFLKQYGGGGGSAPADWNAAEGEPGHVLNRTHWVEDNYIIPETTLNFALQPDFYGLVGAMLTVPNGSGREPDRGYDTIINYNGVDYPCPFARDVTDNGFLGNQALASALIPGAVDTGEPFFIYWMPDYSGSGYDLWAILPKDGTAPATFSARILEAKPMDSRYIDIPVLDLIETGMNSAGTYVPSDEAFRILQRGLQLGMIKMRSGEDETIAIKVDKNTFIMHRPQFPNMIIRRYYVHPVDKNVQVTEYRFVGEVSS